MTTINEVKAWSPSGLETVADSMTDQRTKLLGLTDELTDAYPTALWLGTTADAARTKHQQLCEDLAAQTQEYGSIIAELESTASTIRSAQADIAEAEATAATNGVSIDGETGDVTCSKTFDTEEDKVAMEKVMEGIALSLSAAVRNAGLADQILAAVLLAAQSSDPAEPADLGSQILAGKTPAEVAAIAAKDPALFNAALNAMPPADREALLNQLMDYALSNPDSFAAALPAMPISFKDDLAKTIAAEAVQFANNRQAMLDPYIAKRMEGLLALAGADSRTSATMFETLGSQNTANLLNRIGDGTDAVSDAMQQNMASLLRTDLALATKDGSMQNANKFARDLVAALADQTSDSFQITSLTYLLEGQGYSDYFVRGLASSMDYWEREMYHGGVGPELYYLSCPKNDLAVGTIDPMIALMGQFKEHTRVGADFFTEGDAVDGLGQLRSQYYFGERVWRADDYASVASAVEQIGLDPGVNSTDRNLTVSRFFNYFPENPLADDMDAMQGASPHVANLLKAYMPSVENSITSLKPFPDDGSMPETDEIGEFGTLPIISGDDMKTLMDVSLSTEDGMVNVAEGVGAYRQYQLNQVALDGNTEGAAAEVATRMMTVEGYAQGRLTGMELGEAASRDAQAKVFSELISTAAGLVPLPGADQVGDIGSTLIGDAWSRTVDIGTGTVEAIYANNVEAATASANERALNSAATGQWETMRSMMRAGLIDPADVPSDWFDPTTGQLMKYEDWITANPGDAQGPGTIMEQYWTSADSLQAFKDGYNNAAGEPMS